MRPRTVLFVVPFVMALAFLIFGSRTYLGAYGGTILLLAGMLASGAIAGRLAGRREGIGAAALFFVFQSAFLTVALLAGQSSIR